MELVKFHTFINIHFICESGICWEYESLEFKMYHLKVWGLIYPMDKILVFFFFLGIQTKLNFLGILTTAVSPQTNDQDCISTNKKPQTNDQHLIDGLQRHIQQCCD